MKSLVTEIIPERLGPVTADFPDASYKNEAAGVLPTPVLAQFMTSYHYSVLRFLDEAGLTINDLIDDINNNQFWDAYYANTNKFILENSGLSPIAPRLISGAARTLSSMPDFLRANGSSLEFIVLGDTTSLVMSTNNKEFITDQDIVVVGVTAAPAANNTADINDVNIVADLYAGESDAAITEIIINNVGANVSSKVGQVVAFKTPSGEIFQGLLKTSTLITNVFRGYYFDDLGSPIPRNVLSNGNTITIMNIGWAFIDSDGLTVDVSYLTPIFLYDEPSAPVVGQYWFNMVDKVWNLHSGVSFDVVDSVSLGEVVSDSLNTVASRPNDFSNQFNELNNIEIEIDTTEIIKSKSKSSRINVYGTELQIDLTKLSWDITTDLEAPLIETVSTLYYLYVSDEGQEIVSDEKPFKRLDLKGFYHPHSSLRCVGVLFNDSGSDITLVDEVRYNNNIDKKTMFLKDLKAPATAGGGASGNTTATRILNTLTGNASFLSLASNQFRLLPGRYLLKCSAPAYGVDSHQAFLYNASDLSYHTDGESIYASNSYTVQNDSHIYAEIIIGVSLVFEIKHYTQTISSPSGFGVAAAVGTNPSSNEVYTQVQIDKID